MGYPKKEKRDAEGRLGAHLDIRPRGGLKSQISDLKAAGCEEAFAEQVSSVAQRAKLKEAITFIHKGDTLVVTWLDRLARSTRDLLELRDRIKSRGAPLNVLNLGHIGAATGELVFTVIGASAQFERMLILERQREGIAKAKAEGKYKGRPAKLGEKLGETAPWRQKECLAQRWRTWYGAVVALSPAF